MSRLTKPVLLTFIAATLIGACLHFVYALFPCAFTAALLSRERKSLGAREDSLLARPDRLSAALPEAGARVCWARAAWRCWQGPG